MPSETFQATATTSADPAKVWEGMQRPEVWEGIAGVERVSDPEFHPDGSLARFRFAATAAGRSYPGMAEVTESTPGQSMSLQLNTSELAATIALALQGEASGTRLTIDVEIRSLTFMASLFFAVVADVLGRGLPAAAEDFAQRIGP
ncbi:MAG: SRPBCC family protein [Acidimicrobiia bacterium]